MATKAHAAAVRREQLAHAIARGLSIEKAMLEVGYSENSARCGRIKHGRKLVSAMEHPEVAARVAEIRAGARQRAEATTATIADQLDEAYEMAKRLERPAQMVSAANSKAKLLGLIVDKVDVNAKSVDEMTEAELEMWLRRNGMEDALAALRADEETPPETEAGQRRTGRRAASSGT